MWLPFLLEDIAVVLQLDARFPHRVWILGTVVP